jgi:hypothetical protein
LQDWVLDQDALHVDKSGWRTGDERGALSTATTPSATFLRITSHRDREQFRALIGPFPGIVIPDRWNGFARLDPQQRQVCWSHIQHYFRRHAVGLAVQKTFGEQGLELTRLVFKAWRAYQHERHDRARLVAEIAPIRTELRKLCQTPAREPPHPVDVHHLAEESRSSTSSLSRSTGSKGGNCRPRV